MRRCCVNKSPLLHLSSMSFPKSLPLPQGLRATRAVRLMLTLLPQQPHDGWTQSTLEQALSVHGVNVNRATVYRALDRFVQAGLLQRRIDLDRTTHYFVTSQTSTCHRQQMRPHMECASCHQQFSLGQTSAAVQAALQALQEALVQSGEVHNPSLLDITVQGQCARCAPASTSQPPLQEHT